jgi:hypothetical protein
VPGARNSEPWNREGRESCSAVGIIRGLSDPAALLPSTTGEGSKRVPVERAEAVLFQRGARPAAHHLKRERAGVRAVMKRCAEPPRGSGLLPIFP